MISENELAYFAGLFDGEGCVLIYKRKTLIENGVTVPYQMRVVVTNTHQGVIEDLKRTFRGSIYAYKPTGGRPAWKWTAQCKAGSEFLKLVYPYLRIKKEQADVALEFQGLISKSRHRKHPGFYGQPRISPEDIEKRDNLAQRILDLRKPVHQLQIH